MALLDVFTSRVHDFINGDPDTEKTSVTKSQDAFSENSSAIKILKILKYKQ